MQDLFSVFPLSLVQMDTVLLDSVYFVPSWLYQLYGLELVPSKVLTSLPRYSAVQRSTAR